MDAKPELEELYRRAAADPRSLSRVERNAILGRPPPEEEDWLCVAKTGLTRAGLVAKAFFNPGELTLCEAQILCHHRGVNYDATKPAVSGGLEELEVTLVGYLKEPTPLKKSYKTRQRASYGRSAQPRRSLL